MLSPHPITPGAVLIKPGVLPKIDKRCPVIVPMSKDLKGDIRIEPVPGLACPCKCYHPQLNETINSYLLDYETEMTFVSGGDCDKVKKAGLLDGCYIKIEGRLQLRDALCPDAKDAGVQPPRDQELVLGCQRGDFTIYRPVDPNDTAAGFLPVFVGELIGTVGFDPKPHEHDHSRCCQENHVHGMLKGRGVGVMQDCEICLTYEGDFDSLDDLDLCRGHNIGWKIWLDGVVICPCPEQADDKKKKEDVMV